MKALVCLLLWGVLGRLAPGADWPLLERNEPVATYAQRVGLEATRTLDLGNGITLECVLVPPGKSIVGWPEPESVWVGGGILLGSLLALGLMLGYVVLSSLRRKRLQYSLRWLVGCVVLGSMAIHGGCRWWTARDLWRAPRSFPPSPPAHEVTLSQPFYMGRSEVTQAQYEQVMRCNPSGFKGAELPVHSVTWHEAREFCERVSRARGVAVRLPSENEWEYACRAGTVTRYHSGNSEAELARVAWYEANSGDIVHSVGRKAPNAFGLHDMHGNVHEWCEDDYHDSCTDAPTDARAWVDSPRGAGRVFRGGAYKHYPRHCQSDCRGGGVADVLVLEVGFRIALSVQ